jgi:glycerol-3-phosphate cytidylyltransferase
MSASADLFDAQMSAQAAEMRAQCTAEGKRMGFTASCFDVLHAGHVLMLADAHDQCDVLVVALQTDPTLDRPDTKNKPIQSYEEREIMATGIRHVDALLTYATESDLLNLLKVLRPDVRILGTDWRDKPFTGHELDIPIYWHKRTHNWSTTNLRKRIYEAEKRKLEAEH